MMHSKAGEAYKMNAHHVPLRRSVDKGKLAVINKAVCDFSEWTVWGDEGFLSFFDFFSFFFLV